MSSFGPWYAGKDSSVVEFEASIKKMMGYEMEYAVSSHKGIITGKENIQEGLKRFLDQIYDRDGQILSLLSETDPTSPENLTGKKIIYKFFSEFELYEEMAEKIMITLHLEKLKEEGRVSREEGGYVLA